VALQRSVQREDNPGGNDGKGVEDGTLDHLLVRTLTMLSHKWTGPIIYHLYQAGEALRFRQLQRLMKPVTQKSLTQRLRGLEQAGLVSRTVYAEVPPRVEYQLTELGLTLVALHPPASGENHPGGADANNSALDCSTNGDLNILLHKWAGPIIYHLYKSGRAMRFRQLQRLVKPAPQKELTQRLRELEQAELVSRTVYAEVPPRVEYQLTESGLTLAPLLEALARWAEAYWLARDDETAKFGERIRDNDKQTIQ